MRFIFIYLYTLSICQITFAQVCPKDKYFVRAHERKSYIRTDGVVVGSSNIKAHCRIHSLTSEFLIPLIKEGIPPNWPKKLEKMRTWTETDKDRLLDAFENIPSQLYSKRLMGIYRLQKSNDFPNPATSAEGIISLYDTAFDANRKLARIVVHELVHQKFRELSTENARNYRKATGWRLQLEADSKIYWIGRKDGYVELDGKNSFEEDFANNVEYFLFEPEKLKKMTPSAYDWIKQHYDSNFQLKGIK